MDAIRYLKEKARMTKACTISCLGCLLSISNNKKGMYCKHFELNYPEEAVAIIEKWAAEHPVKTRQSEFLRMFPNVLINDGVLRIHPCDMDKEYIEQDSEKCRAYAPQKLAYGCGECCREYWLAEVE